jgi:phenylacetate-CoA ligase
MLTTHLVPTGLFGDEYASRSAIAALQRRKLVALVDRIVRDVPYYRTLFDTAGVRPSEIAGHEGLAALPTMSKATLRDHGADLHAAGDVVDFVSSSGTTGRPVILPVLREEEPLRVYPIRRVLQELGLGPGDRVLHNFNMFALYVIGYYSALAIREQGCAIVRTGPSMEERQLEVIRQVQPTAFVANPFFMIALAETARTLGSDPRAASLRKGLLATATPFGSDLEPRDVRVKLEESWNLDLTIAHYGSSEIGPIGYECRFHQGYHVHEDILLVERIDPATLDPVPDDRPGELVVTHLDGARAFTAVRYRTGDLVAWSTTEPCRCGRHTLRVGPVIGRVDQQIKLRGQNIVPDFLLSLIDPIDQIAVSAIEAFRREDSGEDWFRVKVGVEDLETSRQIEALVTAKIAAHVPTSIPIEIVQADELRRQQQRATVKAGGNKVVRFFDYR